MKPHLSVMHWFARKNLAFSREVVPGFHASDFSPALQTRLLILQPTPFCNIDCDYCYLPDRQSTARMSLETVRMAARRLVEASLLPQELTVVWHAGEPLTVDVSWYEQAFAVLAEELGAQTKLGHAMQTNALLINDEWCTLFRRHAVRVGVSVDGPAELHDVHRKTRTGKGTHRRVLSGMEKLREHGIECHAIAVVTEETLRAKERFIEFFESHPFTELGCNFDEAEGTHEESSLVGHEDEHAELLKQLLVRSQVPGSRLRVRELSTALNLIARPLPKVRWQGHEWPLNTQALPFAMLNVAHDGRWSTFSPELLGQASVAHSDFVFGNVHDQALLAATAGEAFRRTWHAIARGIQNCERSCAYFSYCGGGSPANKLYELGGMDGAETLYCRSVVKRPFRIVLEALESAKAQRPDAVAAAGVE
ncbi:MAG: GRRM system radical SAM/SPASM domain protein [Rubrivivax sp.]|nr:GRRM system radical SAM/SPASM domain protein [Rubrivivax sp.]